MRKVIRKVLTTEVKAVVKLPNVQTEISRTFIGNPTLSFVIKQLNKECARAGFELVSAELGEVKEAVYEMSLAQFLDLCTVNGTVTITKTFE